MNKIDIIAIILAILVFAFVYINYPYIFSNQFILVLVFSAALLFVIFKILRSVKLKEFLENHKALKILAYIVGFVLLSNLLYSLANLGLGSGNVSECDDKNTHPTEQSKISCIFRNARESNDPSICENLATQSLIDSCMFDINALYQNKTDCPDTEDAINQCQYFCFENPEEFSITHNGYNPSFKWKIVDGKNQTVCKIFQYLQQESCSIYCVK